MNHCAAARANRSNRRRSVNLRDLGDSDPEVAEDPMRDQAKTDSRCISRERRKNHRPEDIARGLRSPSGELIPELMKLAIGAVSLLVHDYDVAIDYYTRVLGFHVVEDTPVGEAGKRWVLVAPPGSVECRLLLAMPTREADVAAIGHQAGNRVFLFLHTDDFWRDYRAFRARGVKFCEEPREEAYGTVAVFADLYGNRWDLLELKPE
jgi:catechol 2,3-dioxygenase-like lactoylglutathione lyase family enzyme